MLAYGSPFDSLYFVASFPIFFHLDEERHTICKSRTAAAATCTASIVIMFLLDFAATIFGPLT